MIDRVVHFVFAVLILNAAATSVAKESTSVIKLPDGVIVKPLNPSSADVRLQIVAPSIIRVTASPDGDFKRADSLMRVAYEAKNSFQLMQDNASVKLMTDEVVATVSRDTGRVIFFDTNGNELLAENARRRFDPVVDAGKHKYAIQQTFDPGKGDAFYGLGQHQNGWFNYRGENVELAQHNISIAAPFIASSGGYGLLWDNNSITRFGDPRTYQGLDKELVVSTLDGNSAGLEGRYYNNDEVLLTTKEADPNYEFLAADQYTNPSKSNAFWPAPFFNKPPEKITWEGRIAAKKNGLHKFRVYASNYIKVWIDGALKIDRWRQNWNPYYFVFDLPMQVGKQHELRIEWLPENSQSYFRIGHLDPSEASVREDLSLFSEIADLIDYYFVAGKTLDQVVSGYRKLTGKSVLLPNWAYGFWQSRQRYTTQNELLEVLKEYRDRKIPIDNIVQDWFYWREDDWGSHQFDPSRFPKPKQMIDAVHSMNARLMISVWPKFYPTTKHYKEFEKIGAIYDRNIHAKTLDWVGDGYLNAFYDAYSASARKLFWHQIQENLDVLGVDAWWLDATEPDIHSNLSLEERKYRMGPNALGTGSEYFNSYALLNAKAIYEGERSGNDPDKRVFILTRSGFPGIQRYAAATWSGDVTARWEDMREQISAGLNMTLSGLPNWTFDIGGFAVEWRYENAEPKHLAEWQELNLRWFQFGAFAPLFRSHGEKPYREIFNLAKKGSEIYDSFVYYNRLRYTLLPYIYSTAVDTYLRDGSIMRPLVMDFADDEITHNLGDQYLFGKSILIAPVYKFKARKRRLYLPKGIDWYDFETNEKFAGGKWIEADAPLTRMPVFIKAGSIIPTGPANAQYSAQALNKDITLLVYSGADGEFRLTEDDGLSYAYESGKYSQIDFSYHDDSKVLKIAKRVGEFEGMPKHRKILIKWLGANPSQSLVQYTGEELLVHRPKHN